MDRFDKRKIKTKWGYLMHLFNSSIMLSTFPEVFIFAGLSAAVVAVNYYVIPFGNPNLPFERALTFVVSFLLVFRNNTAYERFMEGRRSWSDIVSLCKSLGRAIMVNITPDKKKDEDNAFILAEKQKLLKLVLTFTKCVLRLLRERKHVKDLSQSYAKFMKSPSKSAGIETPEKSPVSSVRIVVFESNKVSNIQESLKVNDRDIARDPAELLQEISILLQKHVRADRLVPAVAGFMENSFLVKLTDAYHTCLRIVGTPIPLAYSIHLYQVLCMYSFLFPFYNVPAFGWFTVPISAIIYFIFFGVYRIALQIENPFGHDPNDLPLESYIEAIEREYLRLLKTHESLSADETSPSAA